VDILRKVRDIESTLSRRFDSAARKIAGQTAREPLEIVHAILDAVDREVHQASRGRRVFPYNRVVVTVLAPTQESRRRLDVVLAGEDGLRRRIADKLRAAGCDASGVDVSIKYTGRAHRHWQDPDFHVTFATVEVPKIEKPDLPPLAARLDVTVVRGVAEKRTYSFTADRVDIGRCVEVKDTRNHLIRTNDIAFVEAALEHNETVSRQHAHISYTPGEFRLFDDGSAHGTHIVRQGTTVTVHRGSRGVRLKSGDEIVLGEARMRIRIKADGGTD
jgi:hypothetical protein